MGFIGAITVIGLYAALISRIFRIGKHAVQQQAQLFVYAIGSWIGLQTMTNVASMVALFPLTGVPLPLISYGGSNLVITPWGFGNCA